MTARLSAVGTGPGATRTSDPLPERRKECRAGAALVTRACPRRIRVAPPLVSAPAARRRGGQASCNDIVTRASPSPRLRASDSDLTVQVEARASGLRTRSIRVHAPSLEHRLTRGLYGSGLCKPQMTRAGPLRAVRVMVGTARRRRPAVGPGSDDAERARLGMRAGWGRFAAVSQRPGPRGRLGLEWNDPDGCAKRRQPAASGRSRTSP